MKKMLLLVVSFCAVLSLMAQDVVYIQDGDEVRSLTPEQMWEEMDAYRSDVEITNNAYMDENGVLVIPMDPQVQEALNEQLLLSEEDCCEEEATRGDSYKKGYSNQWGNAESFSVYIDTALSLYGDVKDRHLDAYFYAGGKVFSQDVRIIALDANMVNNNYKPTASASLKIFGQAVWQQSQKIYAEKYWNKSWSATTRFTIGPVPFSVTATIGGKIGFNAALVLASDGIGISGKLTPVLQVNGSANVSFDILLAKAGIKGSLVLLNSNVDFVPTITYKSGIKTALKITANIRTLDGSIHLVGEVFGYGAFDKEIFSWKGFSKSWTICDKKM